MYNQLSKFLYRDYVKVAYIVSYNCIPSILARLVRIRIHAVSNYPNTHTYTFSFQLWIDVRLNRAIQSLKSIGYHWIVMDPQIKESSSSETALHHRQWDIVFTTAGSQVSNMPPSKVYLLP